MFTVEVHFIITGLLNKKKRTNIYAFTSLSFTFKINS